MRFDLTPAKEVSGEWAELAERVGASPFHHPGWFFAWHRAFGRGRLRVLAIRRQGRLSALLPLETRMGRLQSPTNWHSPLFGMVADGEASAQDLARALLDRWAWMADLAFLLEDELGAQAIVREAGSRGWRLIQRPLLRSPYLQIDGDWVRFESGIGDKLLKDLRRRRRRLEEMGRVRFDVSDRSDRLEEGLLVEAAGWKGAEKTAILSRPETADFYRDVAEWAAGLGILRLLFLRVDEKPIAFQFTLEQGGIQYLLKTGYDDEFDRFSPGKILKHEALARAFAVGLRGYDFCGEEAPWKQEWTRDVRERVRIQVFSPTISGRVGHLAFTRGRPFVKRILRRGQSPKA